jgi:anti-anti-sigma factor
MFNVEVIDSIVIIKVQGEINYDYSFKLEDFLNAETEKYETFIIDLSNLNYINSYGLNVLVRLKNKRRNTAIIIPNKQSIVYKVFEVTNIHRLIDVYSNMSEAIDSLKKEV